MPEEDGSASTPHWLAWLSPTAVNPALHRRPLPPPTLNPPCCCPSSVYLPQQRYHYYGRREEAKRMELRSCDELTKRFGTRQAASAGGH